jgi:6-phosphogluconolactonase
LEGWETEVEHSADARELKEVEICPDATSLARAAADYFVTLASEAIATQGRFAVALAGGSTPKVTYALLATDAISERVDWSHVHIFWGDERCVPPDHPDSNYRMAREAWLDHVPLPAGNVHRMRGELEPGQAASEYEETLRVFFSLSSEEGTGNDTLPVARFDLVLLGMGDDAHTASLFPGTAAIDEQTRWVMAHLVEKLHTWRITLTPAAINAAANVIFVVSGSGKAGRLQRVLTGPYQPDVLPAQIVKPDNGRLRWLVDSAAAALLEGEK